MFTRRSPRILCRRTRELLVHYIQELLLLISMFQDTWVNYDAQKKKCSALMRNAEVAKLKQRLQWVAAVESVRNIWISKVDNKHWSRKNIRFSLGRDKVKCFYREHD